MNFTLKMFINRTILGFFAFAAIFSADAAQKTPTHISAVIMFTLPSALIKKLAGVTNSWVHYYQTQKDFGANITKLPFHMTFVSFEFPVDESIKDKNKFIVDVNERLTTLGHRYLDGLDYTGDMFELPFVGFDILHGEQRGIGASQRDFLVAEFGGSAFKYEREQISRGFLKQYPDAITRKDFKAHVSLARIDWKVRPCRLMLPVRLAQLVSNPKDAKVLTQMSNRDTFSLGGPRYTVSVKERAGSVRGGASKYEPKAKEKKGAEETERSPVEGKFVEEDVIAPGGPTIMSASKVTEPVTGAASSAPAASKGAVKTGTWTQEHDEAFEKMFNNKYDDALSYIKERGIDINTIMSMNNPTSLWSIIKYKLNRMNSSQQKAFQEIFDEQAKGTVKTSAVSLPAEPPAKGAVKAAEWTDMHAEAAQLIRNWQSSGNFENFAQAADYIQQGLIPDLTAKEPKTNQTLADIAIQLYLNEAAIRKERALDNSTRWQRLKKVLGLGRK